MSDTQKTPLSLAAGYHLRARPLCDGRVKLKSFELKAAPFEDDGYGHDQFLEGKYDTGEFSLANYCALKSRGAPFMAIPAFPNRKFRQSYIFVPAASPLKEPAELKGKKVGFSLPLKPQDIHWVMPRPNKVEVSLPEGTRLDVVSGQGSLAARMLGGEFDAIIVPDFPEEKGWRRLLADSKTVEQEYFRRTGVFPTSHAITFHAAYLDKHPGAAREMFDACVEAKNLALRDDADATYSNFAWNRQVWEEQQAVMGPDPWKFGIKGNEKALNALIRYADEQGLFAKKMTITDLFIPMDEADAR